MSNGLPSEENSRGRDIEQSTWNKGVIVATIVAAFVIGVVVWLASNIPRSVNNLPPSATGQDSNRPPVKK